jgi:thiosulfate reductase cytochrome b subunit
MPARRWRIGRVVVLVVAVAAVVAGGILLARWMRDQPALQSFLADYPGQATLPGFAPVGIPAWLAWQHGLNAFFLLFVIRSGFQLRYLKRPRAFFTRDNTGLIRTANPPKRIPMELWLHLTVDTLWVLNGVVYVVLLFATGQWVRVVPTSWDVLPNAFSAALQYASMDWPTENGWVNYNALQLLAYFAVVFVLAPVAVVTGLRMSPTFVSRNVPLLPLDRARRLHWASLVAFLVFTATHVLLVLATNALRNLNHMYAARADDGWAGAVVFGASLVVMISALIAARPAALRAIAGRMGTVLVR